MWIEFWAFEGSVRRCLLFEDCGVFSLPVFGMYRWRWGREWFLAKLFVCFCLTIAVSGVAQWVWARSYWRGPLGSSLQAVVNFLWGI